ncbi:MAG: pyridoxal phosphate-dependent aminotransferase, partial [Bacilli bacterium]|nr:pyridoxal phosphate-dependent aminotransferase [Bacilli bacterium]
LLKCLEEDSLVFSEKAKSLDLLLVPTDAFGLKGYVRISYCVDTDVIERSLPAFKRLKEMYGR